VPERTPDRVSVRLNVSLNPKGKNFVTVTYGVESDVLPDESLEDAYSRVEDECSFRLLTKLQEQCITLGFPAPFEED